MREKLVVIGLSIGLSLTFCMIVIGTQSNPTDYNLAYIDTIQLFDEFDMKKEFEKKLEGEEKTLQYSMDSIKVELNGLYKILESASDVEREDLISRIKKAQYLLDKRQEEFNAFSYEARATYNTQIQNQLNTYLKEFGKENDYEFLLGANGQGNILFSKENYDKTDMAILYINELYNGK